MSDGLFLCIEFTMTGQLIDLASVGVTTHKRNEMCYIQIAKRSVSQIFCLSSLYRKTAKQRIFQFGKDYTFIQFYSQGLQRPNACDSK